jgi:hypothetical protein
LKKISKNAVFCCSFFIIDTLVFDHAESNGNVFSPFWTWSSCEMSHKLTFEWWINTMVIWRTQSTNFLSIYWRRRRVENANVICFIDSIVPKNWIIFFNWLAVGVQESVGGFSPTWHYPTYLTYYSSCILVVRMRRCTVKASIIHSYLDYRICEFFTRTFFEDNSVGELSGISTNPRLAPFRSLSANLDY